MSTIALHVLLSLRNLAKVAQRKKEGLVSSQTFHLFSSRPSSATLVDATPTFSVRRGSSSASTTADEAYGSMSSQDPLGERTDAKLALQVFNASQPQTTSVLFPAVSPQPSEKQTSVQAILRRSTALGLVYRNLLVSALGSLMCNTRVIVFSYRFNTPLSCLA